jgi:maltose/moltooligosaccharide transporter
MSQIAAENSPAIPGAQPPICLEQTPAQRALVYTKAGLVGMFFWMLWGDFCFTLMESTIPRLLPLTLKDLGASNRTIGLLVGSIPGVLNMVITPVVSYRSDRYRSRWGRRIPYLLWPSPFIALFLVITGYATDIGHALQGWFSASLANVSPNTVILAVISISVVGFQFFNMIVGSIYYYLFADVVPAHLMGRFMGLFRVVGASATFVFNRWIFGLADTHMKQIYIGIGVLYLVSFTLMCLRVKEGDYPPPPPQVEGPGVTSAIKTYFIECFSNSYYVWFFLGTTLYTVGMITTSIFSVFFAESLGMNLDGFGKVMSWVSLLSLVLSLPMGYLSDKIHPLRMGVIATAGSVVLGAVSFFAIRGPDSFRWFTIIMALATIAYGAANLPMYAILLPKDRYGQFCSAQAMINALAMILANYLAGWFIDATGSYRYIYAWYVLFTLLSLACMIPVYFGWKRYGGDAAYVPPNPAARL